MVSSKWLLAFLAPLNLGPPRVDSDPSRFYQIGYFEVEESNKLSSQPHETKGKENILSGNNDKCWLAWAHFSFLLTSVVFGGANDYF